VGLQQLNGARPSLLADGLARLAHRSFFGRRVAVGHVDRAGGAEHGSGQESGHKRGK
jgi:hypothetical protein